MTNRLGLFLIGVLVATALLAVMTAATCDPSAPTPVAAPAASVEPRPDEADLEARDRRAMARRRARLDRLTAARREAMEALRIEVVGCRGVAASGAEVSVLDGDATRPLGVADEAGRLEIRVRTGAAVAVVASHQGEVGAATRQAEGRIRVLVCPGATLHGRVLDRGDRPVEGAVVTLGDEADLAITEPDGTFVLTDVDLTADRVEAQAELGSARVALEPLMAHEDREITLRLERGRRIEGVVVHEDGDVASWVDVVAFDEAGEVQARARSDRSGRFWLREVPWSRVLVEARADGVESDQVPVGPEDPSEGLVLVLGRAGSRVLGRVVGPDGEPLEAAVRLSLGDAGQIVGQTSTAAEGRFVLELGDDVAGLAMLEVRGGGAFGQRAARRRNIPLGGGDVDLGTVVLRSRGEWRAMFQQRRFGGVGARIEMTDEGIGLTQIAAEGPLGRAGLVAGDVIVRVGGQRVSNLFTWDAVATLRGEPGTAVDLVVRRDGQEVEVTAEREVIDIDDPAWKR